MVEIPRMVTVQEAHKLTNLSNRYLYGLCKSGSIVALQVGSKWLINFDRLIDYLNTAHLEQPEPLGTIRRVC